MWALSFCPASVPALCVCYQRKRRKMEQNLEQNLSTSRIGNAACGIWHLCGGENHNWAHFRYQRQQCCKWLKHNIIIWRPCERHLHYWLCCVSRDCVALFQGQVMAACLTYSTFSWLNIAVYNCGDALITSQDCQKKKKIRIIIGERRSTSTSTWSNWGRHLL